MYNVTINLYHFNELSEKAKEKAIDEHATFLSDNYDDYKNIDRKDIIDDIEVNDYIFFENGELANTTTYTGKHEKAGITELNFYGRIYKLS